MFWANARATLESSNLQQAATSAFICLLVSLFSVVGSVCLLNKVMHAHVSDMLLNDARALQVRAHGREPQAVIDTLREQAAVEKRPAWYSLVVDAHGVPLYGDTALLPLLACDSVQCQGAWRRQGMLAGNGHPQEMLGLTLQLDDGSRYLAAYDLQPMLERTQVVPLLGGAALLAILLGSLAVSLRYSLRGLRRIDQIRDSLQRFASGDHLASPPQDPSGDEIDRLGVEINASLARINRLMNEVRSVTSHIAHELRTPLTRLQNRLVSASEKAEGEMQVELLGAVAESEHLHSLFRTVMRIGEVESGRCAHMFEILNARELLLDLQEYYLPLAEDFGSALCVEVDPGCSVIGDGALLFQALANLTDNALKYSPRGAPVLLFARLWQRQILLGVADAGPGIAPALYDHSTERFSRLDTASGIQGNGLGLTLVKAIADLHGGSLRMTDNQPGLCVSLVLEPANSFD
ncbi:Histidine kinase [Pseudomonas caricapapayae]|uniref:histidine kinase n=1 Tax=Pseudomonas caricapapayae TaxID=46678 RepID=A0A3M6EXB3_9PSED|nr:HAMP domain-containing sensor histidine kinase [Pseudomonas caricapapayae]RMV72787.1 Histidine kinase [Pseudomonas caricapapayae]